MTLEQENENLKIELEDYKSQVVKQESEVNQLHATISENNSLIRLLKKQLEELQNNSGGANNEDLRKQYEELNVLINQIYSILIIPATKLGVQLIDWKAYYESAITKRLEIMNDPKVPVVNKIDFRQSVILFENLEELKKLMNEAFAEDKIKYGLI